jgi:DNA-binding FadR family transcriptional regulator
MHAIEAGQADYARRLMLEHFASGLEATAG